VGTEEFAKTAYERWNDFSAPISCEESLELIDEIKARAAGLGTEIVGPEDEENLEVQRRIVETCSVRSSTMSKNMLALAAQFAGPPTAMQIGAGHTERVKDRLSDAGVSFAVIRPNSFEENAKNGNLSSEAYKRKMGALSVDAPGWVGRLLDDRLKPPPVVGKLWFQSKAELLLLTTLVARAAAQGQLPPFNDALGDVLPLLQSVTLLPDTIEVIGNDVIFGVEARDRNSQLVHIWVRTTRDKDIARQTLNDRLLAALSNVQAKDIPSGEPEPVESEPKLQRVSSDVIAKFAEERSVLNTRIGS
ncbi:MAG: hypothetical protein IMZ46_11745, partial [Acidobacteria bacterium]|nr:hypothetical protein [Acidobacteriota bacterium]